MTPEQIPLGYYTHINFAFALIDPKTFRIAPMDDDTASLYRRVTALKGRQDDLQVWIAIGGWAMNDPGPTRTTFSDLAKSESAQDVFFDSLFTFMMAHDFDGIDLDW
jgi:chitinase